MTEFVKARNLRERPRATLLLWDADGRWLELRCAATEVVQTPAEALAACDDAGFRYCGVRPYFGAVVPAEWAEKEHPVTFRFSPRTVSAGTLAHDEPVVPGHGTAHDEPEPPAAPARATPGDDEARHDEPTPAPATAPATPGDQGGAAGPSPAETTAPPAADDREVPLPESHRALLEGPAIPLLATRDPVGHARVQPVATSLVGHRPVARPTGEQADDLRRDPRATLLVVDRRDTVRWIEVRADAAPAGDGWWQLVPRHVVVDAIHP